MEKKRIRVRMTVEYEKSVPADWNAGDIDFHLHDSSWCADNAFDEIAEYAEGIGCSCHIAQFEYLGDVEGTPS